MNNKYKDKLVGVYAPGSYDHTSVLGQTQEFSKWFWANHEDMPDSEHIFSNKNDAINELHRLRGVKYRNSRMYTVELEEVEA